MKSSPSPFRTITRKVLARNAVFDLYLDHLKGDDGTEIPEFLVVEPFYRYLNAYTGVIILPLINDRILLQQVYRHPVGRWGWELPRGCINENELPVRAAQRELAEETGLFCDTDAMLSLGEIAPEPALVNGRVLIFIATSCREEPSLRQAELECGERRLFSLEEIRAMIGSLDMNCSSSIASIGLYFMKCVSGACPAP